ncbi:MAG: DUF4252 domain-containing protein [Prevotella sp.]|nr:DUF4252 domain-containing protein [Prevotella sp.]MDD7273017.1 DUF4252 domain-containing protein [Prevotellaceae bacterium]MDY3935682.1 DUF4252 domain-containing protein [Prevotella sp.]MDY4217822.1 DUF4252 domain-containing protein [Prevotella sp.]
MKKLFIALAFVAGSLTCSAQNIDDVFEHFKGKENVTFVDLPKELIAMGLKGTNGKKDKELLQKIEHMKVLSFEGATKKVQEEFLSMMKKVTLKGYEELIKVNSEDGKVRIWANVENAPNGSLIIQAISEDGLVLLKFDGKLDKEDLEAIAQTQTGK